MNHEEVGRFWNANADAGTKLARAGFDVYCDYVNSFRSNYRTNFDYLPPVSSPLAL
jgi:hypothetical protein